MYIHNLHKLCVHKKGVGLINDIMQTPVTANVRVYSKLQY